jgi:hypothetical protein
MARAPAPLASAAASGLRRRGLLAELEREERVLKRVKHLLLAELEQLQAEEVVLARRLQQQPPPPDAAEAAAAAQAAGSLEAIRALLMQDDASGPEGRATLS